jgi:hypothetical protein
MQAVDEVEAFTEPERVLAEGLEYLNRVRRVREEQKLVASSRRTSDSGSERDDIALLKELSERRRQPDLYRS